MVSVWGENQESEALSLADSWWWCLMTNALWKLAAVSNKKQAAVVHRASPMPRSVWLVQHAVHGRGCANAAAPHQGSSCSLTRVRNGSKKWGLKGDERCPISKMQMLLKLDSGVEQADFLHLLTQDVIFQQEKKILFIFYQHKKSGDVAHPSLPALISAPGQLTRAHHLMS